MIDSYIHLVFGTLGVALVFCLAAWLALPKQSMSAASKWRLFAQLLAVFVVCQLASGGVIEGGVNPVVTSLVTYSVGRWALLRA